MSKKPQPTKDPFIKYYILWPIESVIESVIGFFRWVWRTITGAWWCDHCETYHGRRVHKFTYYNYHVTPRQEYYMCSLGRDAKMSEDKSQEPSSLSVLATAMKSASDSVATLFEQIGKDLTT